MYSLLLAMKNRTAGAAICEVVTMLNGVQVVEYLEDPSEARERAGRLRPDLVLLSDDLPGQRLLTTIQGVLDEFPDAVILVLSTHNDSQLALRAIEAGARGYMLDDRAFEELGAAIETVMSGAIYLSPGVAGALPLEERRPRSLGTSGGANVNPLRSYRGVADERG